MLPFLEQYRSQAKEPRPVRQVPLWVKQKVWRLRERQENACGQKIAYFLEREFGIHLSVPKIYEILSEKYILRQKGRRKQRRGPAPEADAPRQVVQMDSIPFGMDSSIPFGRVFAFTAVDIFSKETDVLLLPSLTAKDGRTFLQTCLPRRFDGFVQLLQRDGGSEFEAEFTQTVGDFCHRPHLGLSPMRPPLEK